MVVHFNWLCQGWDRGGWKKRGRLVQWEKWGSNIVGERKERVKSR